MIIKRTNEKKKKKNHDFEGDDLQRLYGFKTFYVLNNYPYSLTLKSSDEYLLRTQLTPF